MKYIIVLLLLPSLAFGGRHEDKSAEVAAKINACAAKSKAAAVAVNQKKVWIISETPKTVTTTTSSWNTRAPVGHTHTCSNGHTWDHKLSTSHNCPYCGQFVNVQDQSPRPVTVRTQPNEVRTQTVEMFTMPARVGSAGNCANGQCQNPSMRFIR